MSTPSPLNPQGSPLEQSARRRTLPYAVALFAAFHVLALGGLLFLGCSPEKSVVTPPPLGANDHLPPGPLDSNPAPVAPVEPVVTQTPLTQSTPTPPLSTQPITPAPAPAPAPAGEYKIRVGDNAYVIAKARNIPVKALLEANPNLDWKHLKVNQSIQLPAATADTAASGGAGAGAQANATAPGESVSLHEVKQGDTLMRLAKKYGVTVKAIRAANELKSDSIRIGQKLKIPARTAAANGSAPANPTASRGSPEGTLPQPSASEPVALPLPPQPK
ncbi:MAG: LysM peptidoglycan-binding domain-containing protein [Pedosphaera sp.]|nr:LysM peptidoglycan-binding domain-containing protein [Pedosphaera sp.]